MISIKEVKDNGRLKLLFNRDLTGLIVRFYYFFAAPTARATAPFPTGYFRLACRTCFPYFHPLVYYSIFKVFTVPSGVTRINSFFTSVSVSGLRSGSVKRTSRLYENCTAGSSISGLMTMS